MHRTLIPFLPLFVGLSANVWSQTTSYLGWYHEGEGNYLAFRLRVDSVSGRLADSLEVVDSFIQGFHIPKEETLLAWQKIFLSVKPLKARIVGGQFKKNRLRFDTESLIVDSEGDWQRFSFKGDKTRDGSIKGWLTSDWCPKETGGEVYSDRERIVFLRE